MGEHLIIRGGLKYLIYATKVNNVSAYDMAIKEKIKIIFVLHFNYPLGNPSLLS